MINEVLMGLFFILPTVLAIYASLECSQSYLKARRIYDKIVLLFGVLISFILVINQIIWYYVTFFSGANYFMFYFVLNNIVFSSLTMIILIIMTHRR